MNKIIAVFVAFLALALVGCTPATEEVLKTVCATDFSQVATDRAVLIGFEEGAPGDIHPAFGAAANIFGADASAARFAFGTGQEVPNNLWVMENSNIPTIVENRTNAPYVLIDLFVDGPRRIILGMVHKELPEGPRTLASLIGSKIGETDQYLVFRSLTNDVQCVTD